MTYSAVLYADYYFVQHVIIPMLKDREVPGFFTAFKGETSPISSPIHHLRTANTVTVPRFNTYFMKNSIAFRSSIVRNLLTPDLAKTSNFKNYTRMASKSDKLRNLDFQAESPKQCLTIMITIFYIIKTISIYFVP